jgi:hypothetical protein
MPLEDFAPGSGRAARLYKTFDADVLKAALQAADAVVRFKTYTPRGLLLILVSALRDDIRGALGYSAEARQARGNVASPVGALTTAELETLSGAVGTLLQERFAPFMEDPELPRLLAGFHGDLMAEKAERAEPRARVP